MLFYYELHKHIRYKHTTFYFSQYKALIVFFSFKLLFSLFNYNINSNYNVTLQKLNILSTHYPLNKSRKRKYTKNGKKHAGEQNKKKTETVCRVVLFLFAKIGGEKVIFTSFFFFFFFFFLNECNFIYRTKTLTLLTILILYLHLHLNCTTHTYTTDITYKTYNTCNT